MAGCEINAEAFAPLDHWSRLSFHELLDEARQTYAAGRLDQTFNCCLVGLSRFPDSPPLLAALGWVHAQQNELATAQTMFRHALCRDSHSVDAHAGLAAALSATGEPAAAIAHFERALELNAEDPQTWFNFGCALLAIRRFDAAIDALERSLSFDPTNAQALHNLAVVQAQLGRWEAVVELCSQALSADPGAWQAKLLRGMARVALGKFAEGWDDYEARCKSQEGYLRHLELPRWAGPGDCRESIAVVPEQGIGTQLLFASCVNELAEHVSHVTVGCEPRLIGLLRRALPAVHVVAGGLLPTMAKCGLFDGYIMAGSLPGVFRRRSESFRGVEYLVAEPLARQRWRQRLEEQRPGLKIGVSWGGGARVADASHRHTTLDDWRPLATIEGVDWINLQYDAKHEELDTWRDMAGERFHDWEDLDRKHDLENVAALVSEVDLVITVVNSTVHLAGALGTPTWTMIPRGGEWRWQTDGEHCLWHNSVRLFRQQHLDDWSGVFDHLRSELESLVEHRRRWRASFTEVESARRA